MKYSSQGKQYRLDLFSTTLEKSLDRSNRWHKLAESMPWDEIERAYTTNASATSTAAATSLSVGCGSTDHQA